MINRTDAVYAATLIALSLLAGCNKASGTDPKAETVATPAAPGKPVVAGNPAAVQPAPAASAGTDASVTGTEARAGDVSVKLPE